MEKLKAGIELDKLVAEKVMGWDVTVGGAKETFWRKHMHGETYDVRLLPPKYSTDIAAAWEVVEKFTAFNPFWEESHCLNFQLTPTSGKGWMCNFGDTTTIEYADTAPHAICLAALKILE